MNSAREIQRQRVKAGGGLTGTPDANALSAKGKGKKGDGGKGKGKKGDGGKGKDSGKNGDWKTAGDGEKVAPHLMFCRTFAKEGACPKQHSGCPYNHVSRNQIKKIFGFDIFAGGKGDGGKSKGGGKDKKGGGGGKRSGSRDTAAPATDASTSATVAAAKELAQLKSKAKYCAAYIKGSCNKGSDCVFARVEPDVASELKRADQAYKKNQADKRGASVDPKKTGNK